MERPVITVTNAHGLTTERDMDDKEFAEYKARIEAMHDKIEELETKLKVRTNKLANP
jgi:peptidoglycan hydrolase CwlO-like protein